MRGAASCLLLVTGCATVFDIEHVDEQLLPECTPRGHDEDGDGVDDSCDPCPFDAANTPDSDGDAIADACDPVPDTPNTRLHFDGFDGSIAVPYLATGGGIDNGAFTVSGITSGGLIWNGAGEQVWLVTSATVTAVDYPGTYREVGAIFDGMPSPSSQANGTYAVLGIDTDNENYIQLYARNRPDADESLAGQYDPTVTLDKLTASRITCSYARGEMSIVSCVFAVGGSQSILSGTRPTLPTLGGAGIYAANVDVAFPYLFVVGP